MFGFGFCTCKKKYQGDPHQPGCPAYTAPAVTAPRPQEMGPCTCGVKHTGGLHSEWCDSLKPKPRVPPAYEYGSYDSRQVWWPHTIYWLEAKMDLSEHVGGKPTKMDVPFSQVESADVGWPIRIGQGVRFK